MQRAVILEDGPMGTRIHGGPDDEGLQGPGRWEYNACPPGGAALARGSMTKDGPVLWKPFSEKVSSQLEQAYLRSDPFCDLGVIGGQQRIVQFGRWCDEAASTEHPFQASTDEPWKKRSVRRVSALPEALGFSQPDSEPDPAPATPAAARPDPTPCEVPSRRVGEVVYYHSTSNGGWVASVVTHVHADGAIEINQKPGTLFTKEDQATKVRTPPVLLDAAAMAPAAPDTAPDRRVGDVVEYLSRRNNGWIACAVTQVHPDGSIEISVKPGERLKKEDQLQKVRAHRDCRSLATAPAPAIAVGLAPAPGPDRRKGEALEYLSDQNHGWVPCTVIDVHPDGSIEINVKAGHRISIEEQQRKVRTPDPEAAKKVVRRISLPTPAAPASSATKAYAVGDRLVYSKGGPAIVAVVKHVDANGNLTLQPEAPGASLVLAPAADVPLHMTPAPPPPQPAGAPAGIPSWVDFGTVQDSAAIMGFH